MSLAQMIEAGIWPELHNWQCRTIAGIDPSVYGQSRAALEAARRNVAACTVWGLTERFDETLLLLRESLGWHRLWYIAENTTSRGELRAEHSAAELAAVERSNALDLELYRDLQPEFQARLDAEVPDWEARLERLRLRNAMRRPAPHLRVAYEELVVRHHERRRRREMEASEDLRGR